MLMFENTFLNGMGVSLISVICNTSVTNYTFTNALSYIPSSNQTIGKEVGTEVIRKPK